MKNSSFICLLLITAISLMAVALYNGFPLVEGDTGAYIEQAIYAHFAPDRPPFYGIFLRVTSLWVSLWYPVFVQCLILSFLLLKYIRMVPLPASPTSGDGKPMLNEFPFSLTVVIVIISFTCVAWVSAYLMPDIFTGILLLAILLFLTGSGDDKKLMWAYMFIIFGATAIHYSHFAITILFATALFVWSLIKKQKMLMARSLALICISMSVYILLSSMNAAKKYGFTFSRGADMFMVAKLAETGILNTYLDENCDKKNLKLCNYKNEIPSDLSGFLWDKEKSPLYKMGGWDSCRKEYGMITHDIFTTPRYMKMVALKSIESTLKELTQVQAPDYVPPQGKDLQPWKKVQQYFADEFREYNMSLQNTSRLSATSCNYFYYLFFILSSIWALLFYPDAVTKEMAFIYKCILLFFVINACVTSTFSTVIYRFQYRVFWILPATNAIVIMKYYRDIRKLKEQK